MSNCNNLIIGGPINAGNTVRTIDQLKNLLGQFDEKNKADLTSNPTTNKFNVYRSAEATFRSFSNNAGVVVKHAKNEKR